MTSKGQADDVFVAGGTRVFLPPEISFLAFYGVHLATLWDAGRIAGRSGVTADQAILTSGLVDEETFYRSLAQEMRLPFMTLDQIVVGPGARFPDCVVEGRLPLAQTEEGPSIALAPKGAALLRLLGARNRNISGLAIVTPSTLLDAALIFRAGPIAEDAAEDLFRRDPDLCYRGGLTNRQIAALAVTVLVASASLVMVTTAALLILTLLISLPFFTLAALRIGATTSTIPIRPPQRHARSPDADLPVYTIIVPLYRERRILPRLVAALQALDYPAAKLDVKLVIEADDAETADALARLALPGGFQIVRAPAGHPRTKPRALNVALPLARGEYAVVYDAEDVPDPGQLRLAVSTFAGSALEVACLQARLAIDNTGDSLLTRGIR